jgi:propionyl-CoA synthetase
MPMVIESIIAILACARIGATHVVVFGGFSAHELANRIVDCKPKLVILANAGK